MLLKISVLLVLSLGCVHVGADHCEALNNGFGTQSYQFMECVLKNNEKATFCLNCNGFYSIFLSSYNDLINGKDGHGDCRSRFIDNNQLDIVESVYANTKRLWDSGFCSDCYVADCDFSNETADCSYSNRTAEFLQLHNTTEDCINHMPNRDTICKNCSTNYEELNKVYNDIRFKTADKFCFAIKDMMNKTRIHWSKELHCCEDRKNSKEDFFALSSSSVFLSVVFYIAIYLFGLRKERIQDIPHDLMPPSSDDRNQSNGTIMNINAEEPSTSESPEAIEPQLAKKINLSDDSSSDDDEDILPIENPNLIQID